MTTALGGLYGMLYAILKSEDNALLMGSLLLFFALAAVMLVTRRVDWYRLGPTLGLPENRTAQDAGASPGSAGNA
jgi:inner membrane protein